LLPGGIIGVVLLPILGFGSIGAELDDGPAGADAPAIGCIIYASSC